MPAWACVFAVVLGNQIRSGQCAVIFDAKRVSHPWVRGRGGGRHKGEVYGRRGDKLVKQGRVVSRRACDKDSNHAWQ